MQHVISGDVALARVPNFRLVGRDDDLKKLSSILIRSKANSILLVGAGGVGCTALCLGLQASKAIPDAPFDIVSKRIFWLDTDGLFSSGDSQAINASFQKVMQMLARTPESVLIIEDFRDFIEAARNSGNNHFINGLVLAVKTGKTQAIFETRDDDLDVVLKAHSDMREQFTMIDLEEPHNGALIQIVEQAAESLVKYHNIKIDQDAILAAVDLTNRYRTRDMGLNRAQPERSVTLLDRTLASYRLEAHQKDATPEEQTEVRRLHKLQRDGEKAIMDLEDELDKQLEREDARAKERKGKDDDGQYEAISNVESKAVLDIRNRMRMFQAEVDKNRQEFIAYTSKINSDLSITRDQVLQEFSKISGIAVNKLNEDARVKLMALEGDLKKRIFGQDDAVVRLANSIKVARLGRRNADKPQASFLFMGPSGVGKTEMGKALAEILLDDAKALTRFDMSEYMEKHAVAKLIGAPPGYEGFEAGGILTNAMRKNPYRVLLFDEIEKGHPDVFNIFLQILSDGRLTDNVGRTVSFSDAIVLMTTNIGQPFFLDETLTEEDAEDKAREELNNTYRSEFLNRFNGRQNIVCFHKLGLESIERIVKREITGLISTYSEQNATIILPDSSVKQFVKDHYDPKIGARGLPGYINAELEPVIVNTILESGEKKLKMTIDYEDSNKSFKVKVENGQ